MGESIIIFLTVGTGNIYGFDRLIKKMDDIAGKLDEEVVMQIGCTMYKPKNGKYFHFLRQKDIEELYQNSKIIICHAGIGSILAAMNFNKPAIIIPRRKKYNEHIDDHQMQISNELEREGLITVVYDVEKLESTLSNFSAVVVPMIKTDSKLAQMLKLYFNDLEINLTN